MCKPPDFDFIIKEGSASLCSFMSLLKLTFPVFPSPISTSNIKARLFRGFIPYPIISL